jgi:glutamyl-tRNA reductase
MTAPRLATVSEAAVAQHSGVLALSTCQRMEVYTTAPCACDAPQQLHGRDALQHLAEVAAGLHSVVLGEDEVMGQVRTALRDAPAPLRTLGDIAIAAARQLRREETFDSHSGHLLDRALRLGSITPEGTLLVIGTGKMGKLVAMRGAEIGFERIIVAGRREQAPDWVAGSGFNYAMLDALPGLGAVEVAAGCLGSAAGELNVTASLPPVHHLLLDLGTPRNFSGESCTPQLTIAQLLDRQHDHRHGTQRRAALRERLHDILDARLAAATRDSGSQTGALRLHVEQARQRELARIQRLHPDIDPQTLDTITRSLVNQLFHQPSKRLADSGDRDLAERVVALFAPAEPEAPTA